VIRCTHCHRKLKNPRPSGMGRVCEKKAPLPPAAVERDLFGYDVAAAASAAQERVALYVQERATLAHAAVRAAFKRVRAEQ